MSRGIEITGSKDGAKAKVTEQLDKIAELYDGKPEADDVVSCKVRILALIDAAALGVDSQGTDWNGVSVRASGSHGTTMGMPTIGGVVTSANFSIQLTRVVLALK